MRVAHRPIGLTLVSILMTTPAPVQRPKCFLNLDEKCTTCQFWQGSPQVRTGPDLSTDEKAYLHGGWPPCWASCLPRGSAIQASVFARTPSETIRIPREERARTPVMRVPSIRA